VASPFIFVLLHSTSIRPQEAKESIDEEDSRPTSSTWSYIIKDENHKQPQKEKRKGWSWLPYYRKIQHEVTTLPKFSR